MSATDPATGAARGGSATITFAWDDAAERLTIGARAGDCAVAPACAAGRTFQLVRVAPGHGVGVAPTAKPDRVVTYTGAMLTVSLKQ